jgi:glycosyltransferase involved in cell wall biosynthesis
MRISVALCTYNGSRFVREQLASVLSQTRVPDELVVCDDCSEDDTVDMVLETLEARGIPFTIKRNPARLGPTKNFEQAISLCTGDVIALCDQDDVWMPGKLAKLEQVFLENPDVSYVFSDAMVVDEALRLLGYTLWEAIGFGAREQKKFEKGAQLEVLLRHNVVTGATLAFHSELREAVLPIPPEWVHDAWIALIAASYGKKGIAIRTPLILYRQHESQAIGGRKLTIRDRLYRARATRREEYLRDIRRYQQVQERLRVREVRDSQVEGLLEGKIRHLQARACIWDRSGIQALSVPIRELAMGRYWKFSHGWSSFGKDFLVAIGWARERPSRRADPD